MFRRKKAEAFKHYLDASIQVSDVIVVYVEPVRTVIVRYDNVRRMTVELRLDEGYANDEFGPFFYREHDTGLSEVWEELCRLLGYSSDKPEAILAQIKEAMIRLQSWIEPIQEASWTFRKEELNRIKLARAR